MAFLPRRTNSAINIVNTKGLTFTGTGSSVINGNITSTGTPATLIFASGSVTLNGISNAPVGATLTSGTLDLGNQNALQTNVLTYSTGALATLVFDQAVTSGTYALGGLAGTSNITLQNNAGAPAAVSLILGNSISTTASFFWKFGGRQCFNQSRSQYPDPFRVNTYTGPTTVSAGTLELTKEVHFITTRPRVIPPRISLCRAALLWLSRPAAPAGSRPRILLPWMLWELALVVLRQALFWASIPPMEILPTAARS